MTSRRAAYVSILLAGAALLGVIGGAKVSNDEPAMAWFAWAGAFLVAALVANFWPATDRMPLWQRASHARERRRLRRSAKEGWEAGNRSGLRGSLLTLTGTRGRTAAGFYCEVHSPIGVFDAYTPAVQQTISKARGLLGEFAMPEPSSDAYLVFPDEFRLSGGASVPSLHDLPTGTYHQLWWAWERAENGMDLEMIVVALGSFDFYQVGGPKWRKKLAHLRAERRARKLQRKR
jgi:MFS family permease